MIATLTRAFQNDNVTLGMLQIDGVNHIPFYTLENPWVDNKPWVSCIPEGAYAVRPHNGKKFRDVWIVEAVEGRSGILIHEGNTEEDTTGCILVGRTAGTLNGQPAVLESRNAIQNLRTLLEPEFHLVIR